MVNILRQICTDLAFYQNSPNRYLTVMMTFDRQIRNSSNLLHIETIMVPLGGVTYDIQAHLPGF